MIAIKNGGTIIFQRDTIGFRHDKTCLVCVNQIREHGVDYKTGRLGRAYKCGRSQHFFQSDAANTKPFMTVD